MKKNPKLSCTFSTFKQSYSGVIVQSKKKLDFLHSLKKNQDESGVFFRTKESQAVTTTCQCFQRAGMCYLTTKSETNKQAACLTNVRLSISHICEQVLLSCIKTHLRLSHPTLHTQTVILNQYLL